MLTLKTGRVCSSFRITVVQQQNKRGKNKHSWK